MCIVTLFSVYRISRLSAKFRILNFQSWISVVKIRPGFLQLLLIYYLNGFSLFRAIAPRVQILPTTFSSSLGELLVRLAEPVSEAFWGCDKLNQFNFHFTISNSGIQIWLFRSGSTQKSYLSLSSSLLPLSSKKSLLSSLPVGNALLDSLLFNYEYFVLISFGSSIRFSLIVL